MKYKNLQNGYRYIVANCAEVHIVKFTPLAEKEPLHLRQSPQERKTQDSTTFFNCKVNNN